MTLLSSLEDLLSEPFVERQQNVNVLCKPFVRPSKDAFLSEYYYKNELEPRINEFLGKYGVEIKSLYTSLNKEPLKRIGYGIPNAEGTPGALFEQMSKLGDIGKWLSVYYLAGVFNMKSHDDFNRVIVQEKPTYAQVLETAVSGINLLKYVHDEMKKSPEFRKTRNLKRIHEVYTTDISLPYEKEIVEACSAASAGWQNKIIEDEAQGSRPESLGLCKRFHWSDGNCDEVKSDDFKKYDSGSHAENYAQAV
jgi:hypothetical protein